MDAEESLQIIIDLVNDTADIIADFEHGIPSGNLYAMLMGEMTLEQYQNFELLLLATGRVRKNGYLLMSA